MLTTTTTSSEAAATTTEKLATAFSIVCNVSLAQSAWEIVAAVAVVVAFLGHKSKLREISKNLIKIPAARRARDLPKQAENPKNYAVTKKQKTREKQKKNNKVETQLFHISVDKRRAIVLNF